MDFIDKCVSTKILLTQPATLFKNQPFANNIAKAPFNIGGEFLGFCEKQIPGHGGSVDGSAAIHGWKRAECCTNILESGSHTTAKDELDAVIMTRLHDDTYNLIR